MIKTTLKRQLGKLWKLRAPIEQGHGSQHAVVLLYHSIGADSTGVSPTQFREQISWLAANTCVVDLDTIASGEWPHSPSGIVSAITFDDGYVGVYKSAMPVLQEFGCSATVYVSTSTIAENANRSSNQYSGLYKDEFLLSWRELKELSQCGIGIGSHLMHHDDLTTLSREEALEQLTASKRIIEQNIGAPCTSFAYPWGRFSEAAVQSVADAGYESAVIALHKSVRRPSLDRYRIPRTDIRREYSFEDFQEVIRGNWDYLALTQGYRHYRKG